MRKAIRLLAATLICGAGLSFGAASNAHHDIDLETHSCSAEPTPSPGDPEPPDEPELTPPPTEPPPGSTPTPAEPTPAPSNCIPDEEERIWGTRTLRFSTETDGARPIKRVSALILSEEEGIPDGNGGKPILLKSYTREDDVREYDKPFSWNSVVATPRNGSYRLRIDVDTYPAFTGDESHRASAQRLHLRVDNPPRAPVAPKVIATTVSSVTLSWPPAPELDVVSYTVHRAQTKTTARKPALTAFKPVGVTSATTYREKTKPGVYWYMLRVTRRSVVTPVEGISSPLSPMSGAAHVKNAKALAKTKDEAPRRPISYRPLTTQPRAPSRLANAPDAPFAYKLPYDKNVGTLDAPREEPGESGPNDPRGPVLPVAVGMFLLSSALAVGRMPY